MSKLDELIQKYCPNGVEMVELGKVCKIQNGFAFKSNEYVDCGIRVIRISDVQGGYISNKDKKYYPIEFLSSLGCFILQVGELVMSLTGNPGRVAIITEEHTPAALNQRVACLRPKSCVKSRFLFYLFNSDAFASIAYQNSTGGGQKNLSTSWLATYLIPLPPLPVQEEIVRMLDAMSELQENLEKELEERRKQYAFYRDKLLSFNELTTPPQLED